MNIKLLQFSLRNYTDLKNWSTFSYKSRYEENTGKY